MKEEKITISNIEKVPFMELKRKMGYKDDARVNNIIIDKAIEKMNQDPTIG